MAAESKRERLLRRHRERQSRASIRGRLFSGFALFSVILIAVLWLCQVVFLEEIYKVTKIGEIRSAARELRAQVGSEHLEEKAKEIAEQKSVCISVLLIGQDGSVQTLISADSVARCLIHNPKINPHSFYELYQLVKSKGGSELQHYRYDFERQAYLAYPYTTVFDRTVDEQSIVYTTLITDDLGNELMVMLNSVISPVDATVNTLRSLLFAITALMILLTVVLALVLSGRISRPLIALNEKAKRLAGSDYSVDFTSHGYREISELGQTLNAAEAELSKVDRLKTELIANISHDLRTPLTLISGYAEVMRDIPDENTPENLQIIIDEAGRLSSFVNQILDLSKLQSGAVALNPESYDLSGFLTDSIARYNKLLASKEYRLLLDAPEQITVFADRIRVEQVFYNLLSNAITHTGSDKTVHVALRRVSDPSGAPAARICVIDSGEGIEADKLSSIWDRYYKVDKVHKRAQMGSGLGLSIVKAIMEQIGGAYGVESTPGKGSCFWVEIPLKREQ